jgi:hypothetical protein
VKRLRHILIGAALLAAFGSIALFPRHWKGLPPAVMEWTLASQSVFEPPPAGLRQWNGTAGTRRAWHAEYRGSPPISLTVYELPGSPGSAFDAIQQWRPMPGRMAFSKGAYFGVAEAPGADPKVINRFVEGVAAGLPTASVFIQ